jgi:hypothetical protein
VTCTRLHFEKSHYYNDPTLPTDVYHKQHAEPTKRFAIKHIITTFHQ